MKINRNKNENANQSQKYHRYFYLVRPGIENSGAETAWFWFSQRNSFKARPV